MWAHITWSRAGSAASKRHVPNPSASSALSQGTCQWVMPHVMCVNESCLMSISHGTCEWVMSHVNQSCHRSMSHGTREGVAQHSLRRRDVCAMRQQRDVCQRDVCPTDVCPRDLCSILLPPTHSGPPNMCALCVCVCVCVRERERERKRGVAGQRGCVQSACPLRAEVRRICVLCVYVYASVCERVRENEREIERGVQRERDKHHIPQLTCLNDTPQLTCLNDVPQLTCLITYLNSHASMTHLNSHASTTYLKHLGVEQPVKETYQKDPPTNRDLLKRPTHSKRPIKRTHELKDIPERLGVEISSYGVATISRLRKMIRLFCKRAQ